MALIDDDLLSYLSGWARKKKLQIFIRSHLSHTLALLLAVSVLLRELPEVSGKFFHPGEMRPWDIFIISITAVTVIAALWEFGGNKLATSPQEIRFVLGIRWLLARLEKFKREIEGGDYADTSKKLDDFFDFFLKVTSNTLCGKKDVDAGLMLYQESEGKLALHKYTPGAIYQDDLKIPIGTHVTDARKGPAANSFESGLVAYMPKKAKRIGILLEAKEGEEYRLVKIFRGWYQSQSEREEEFCAVLSIPITIYAKEREKSNYGVLNYTTVKGDPFVPRDYIMAECFASILAQAIYAARYKLNKVQTAPALPAPTGRPAEEDRKHDTPQKAHDTRLRSKNKKKHRGKR